MKYKLIVFDMDGVIFQHTNFWLELHKVFGTYEEGVKLTEKDARTDYQKLVNEVVGRLWKDKSAKPYFELVNSVPYVLGVKDPLKEICKIAKIPIKETIAVGHEDGDIEMLEEAGFSIGFNPEEEILKYCNIIVRSNDLRDILPHIIQST